MELKDVRLDVADNIAVVRLARPPVNAFNANLLDETTRVFDALNDRDDVHVVVLTNEGKVFSAGADGKERGTRTGEPGEQWALMRRYTALYEAIKQCRKPVIGALAGHALGGGLMVASVCDILYAAEGVTVGLVEVDVGLLGGARHLQAMFGRSQIRAMVFSGQRVPAAELYRLGAIQACVPPERLMDTAMAMARTIAAKNPGVIRFTKVAANAAEELGAAPGARFEQDMLAELQRHKKLLAGDAPA